MCTHVHARVTIYSKYDIYIEKVGTTVSLLLLCPDIERKVKTMNRETNKVYIGQYGIEMQSLVAVEELSELQKAITKLIRYPEKSTKPLEYKGLRSNLAEEMADVLIVMDQMNYYYGVSDDEINDIIQAKQERMMKNYREGLQ